MSILYFFSLARSVSVSQTKYFTGDDRLPLIAEIVSLHKYSIVYARVAPPSTERIPNFTGNTECEHTVRKHLFGRVPISQSCRLLFGRPTTARRAFPFFWKATSSNVCRLQMHTNAFRQPKTKARTRARRKKGIACVVSILSFWLRILCSHFLDSCRHRRCFAGEFYGKREEATDKESE